LEIKSIFAGGFAKEGRSGLRGAKSGGALQPGRRDGHGRRGLVPSVHVVMMRPQHAREFLETFLLRLI
jgi:hypothetical protein